VFPAFSPQQESDSTQLYQKVPADLLRRARESHLSSAPPPPRTSAASASQLREDPWATADERTAVFAPPPELLASVRAAAASAGLLPSDGPASEPAPSGRITAEFDVAGQVTASPASSEAPEITKVAPPPSEGAETPVTPSVRESSAGSDEQHEHEHEREDALAERRRWPWAVAALLIAAGLAGLAVRSQLQEPSKSPVHAPSR
jgi:hypothetical protein